MTHLYRLYEWYRHSLLKLIHWCVQAEDFHNLSQRNRHSKSELNSRYHLKGSIHLTHTHTCWVVRAVHIVQMESASSWLFFLICRSWAAWIRGSRDSRAPLPWRSLSSSHSSSWHTLYLCEGGNNKNANISNMK